MAKGITDATKFIRAVMAQKIENPVNQPYTVGTGADLVAFLRTVASEMLEDDWIARYGIDVPEGWKHLKASLVIKILQVVIVRRTRRL